MFLFFPFLQLLDLCVLDTGSLQFSYSILAASALNHMLPVKIEQVTGKQTETYKSPLSEQKIPYCKTYLWILQNHNLHCNFWEIIPLPWIKSWGKDCLLLKNYCCRGGVRERKIFYFLPLPPLNPTQPIPTLLSKWQWMFETLK